MSASRPLVAATRRKGGFALLLAVISCLLSGASTIPAHGADAAAVRPYDPESPWNTPIPGDARVLPGPVPALVDGGSKLTTDPDVFAPSVHVFNDATPRRTVRLSGYFSSYDAGDNSRVGHGFAPTVQGIPIPSSALAAAGSDGPLILWDPRAGVEYGFWYFDRDRSGGFVAINGYRYHTTSGYLGRFADGLAGRGGGTPYLAGLVRPWEMARGRIDHALAFTYNSPSRAFVFPASKSNGRGGPTELPVGTRLRLDPTRTEADFDAWGLTAPAKVIARALQRYGMYVVGNSGSSKIYLEDRLTAGWNSSITRNLTRAIPMSAFRVVAGRSGESPGPSPASPPLATARQPDARAVPAATPRVMDQLVRRLRRTRPRSLRLRRGITALVVARSNSALRVTVTGRAAGRHRVLLSGAARSPDRRITRLRLRPTRVGTRLLRPRRSVVIQLSLRTAGDRSATRLSRTIRLRR